MACITEPRAIESWVIRNHPTITDISYMTFSGFAEIALVGNPELALLELSGVRLFSSRQLLITATDNSETNCQIDYFMIHENSKLIDATENNQKLFECTIPPYDSKGHKPTEPNYIAPRHLAVVTTLGAFDVLFEEITLTKN